jgi:hypothetical protein
MRTVHIARVGRFVGALAILMGGALMSVFGAQKQAIEIDIAGMPPAQEPGDFTFWHTGGGGPTDWRVVSDVTAVRQAAIAQTSTDTTGYRFPLAVYKPVSARDVDVTLRLKPVSGKVDQAGGIAVRLTTYDDYYVVRANALEDNVRFYRVVKGRREQIEGVDTKVAGNQWHTLGLRAEGDAFTVSFDGMTLFTARDKTFANFGKVALWTKADSVTYFDTVTIMPLD